MKIEIMNKGDTTVYIDGVAPVAPGARITYDTPSHTANISEGVIAATEPEPDDAEDTGEE